MLRSLYSSISGLQNHQVRMDLIGNNISNVNTTGYKSQRVTFEESFSQLLEGSTRPPGEGGGTNPVQVGLGMSVGSIDTILTQGNVQSTGQVTDVAIEGDAYFAVSDGESTYYTRNGAFQLDSEGGMVLPTNGFRLQGKIANEEGEFPPGTVIDDIKIPFDEQSPAQATERVDFSRNLNSDSAAEGSVLYTQRWLHYGETGDLATGLKDSKGNDLNLKDGDNLSFSLRDSTGTPQELTPPFQITDTTTYADIVGAFNTWLQSVDPNLSASIVTSTAAPGTPADIHPDPVTGLPGADAMVGAIQLDYAGAATDAITNIQITSSGPLSKGPVAKAFNFPSTINGGDREFSDTLRSPAQSGNNVAGLPNDFISELWDENGRELGLEALDEISVNANIGGEPFGGSSSITYDPATTRMQEVLDLIKDELKLGERDGTFQNNLSVSLNEAGTDDNIPDGAMVIRGAPGSDFEISGLTLSATNYDLDKTSPNLFNANASTTEFQSARDTGVFDTSITVYDESGATHDVTMTFIHTGTPGVWDWELGVAGNENVLQGNRGEITFGLDGSVASFNFDDNVSRVLIDPNNGSDIMELELNVGGPGNFQGITQFESATTVSAIGQDGYGTGALTDVSIDSFGFVKGVFTNGTTKSLAQIMVADFTNPGGLKKVADSVYLPSTNSGEAVFGEPGSQSSTKLRPGALELSNVELSREFTDMITTQRGYQANSRVITVSDTMLEELMSLKR